MSVYEYITQAFADEDSIQGDLARTLIELSKEDESVKDIDTFGSFVSLADKVSGGAFRAITEDFFCECCTACGLPIQ